MADASALAAALPIAPGQVLGERYLVGEVLGGGGMGVVCAGTHVLLGTPVAIKLIHSDLKHDAEAVQRFMNEARAAAALKGEHIARVFDVGLLDSGEPYLVMEQLEGMGLDQYLLERKQLGPTETVDIVLQACEGLAEAHAARLVHRDIKPANLFLVRLSNGQYLLKILDFGIAKQRPVDEDTPGLTNPGTSLGSPWYMSPEQMLTPACVDERADVWSLGVLMFELLTGKRPFEGETVPQVCAMVLTATPPRVSEQRSEVPPELDEIVLRCLEKEPERRFASVAELSRALIRFASEPTHTSGIALDAPEKSSARESTETHTPSYGSLTPLATGSSWPAPRTNWSRYLAPAVAAAALLLFLAGGWLTLRSSASRSGAIGCLELPWDPALLPNTTDSAIERSSETPSLLQQLQTALAVAEPRREHVATAEEVEQFTTARAERYEAWLRSQGLSRIPANDSVSSEPPRQDPPAPPSVESEGASSPDAASPEAEPAAH